MQRSARIHEQRVIVHFCGPNEMRGQRDVRRAHRRAPPPAGHVVV